ncbi:MAG TPA: hypothetical protein VFH98_04280, partial [Candidatus Limnocylindria bacterium]|nr:hypothetical protein [Candidatus Limnocylindria bacterium]
MTQVDLPLRPLGLVLILLAFSFGCQPSRTGQPAAANPAASGSPSVAMEEQLDLGPGDLDIADMRVGLTDAASYESVLTITFDGKQDGQPLQWSSTYTYSANREPLARQLSIDASGDPPEPALLMQEMEGVAYSKSGEDACQAQTLDSSASKIDQLEPAAQLPSLFGAEHAGDEALNGVQTAHYTFDERALAQAGLNKTAGELWISAEDGRVMRYHQATTGDAAFFGEATEGTLTYDYELTSIGQPVSILRPADCLAGLVDAPRMPDATNIEDLPGMLRYDTASSVPLTYAFYQKELPAAGWADASIAGPPEDMSAEEYAQAMQALQQFGL